MACLSGGSVICFWPAAASGRPLRNASRDSHEPGCCCSSIFSGGSIGGLSGVLGMATLLGDVECTEPESDISDGTRSRASPPITGIVVADDGDGSSECAVFHAEC